MDLEELALAIFQEPEAFIQSSVNDSSKISLMLYPTEKPTGNMPRHTPDFMFPGP